MKKLQHYQKQIGAVSLFTVLFTTLLLTVLTVGFVRLMMQEQRQAQNQDLSQSAYDSAISGVEDAKRVLRACEQQGSASDACKAIATVPATCDTIARAGVAGVVEQDTEIRSGSGAGSNASLNQFYTCVKIIRNNDDYLGNLRDGDSQIIPLRATGEFNEIRIEWTHRGDTDTYYGGDVENIVSPLSPENPANPVSLPPKSDWNTSAPAMLTSLTVSPSNPNQVQTAELDTATATTSYLRPYVPASGGLTVNTEVNVGLGRANSSNHAVAPAQVTCSNDLYLDDQYACVATLKMPAGKTVPAGSRVAFMRLTSLYRDTSYRITLYRNGTAVQFDGVQPLVDSTGKAGNVYRRVQSRVSLESYASPLSPNAALTTTGDVCKEFYVTDTEADSVDKNCETW